jgi:hypothetical protein
MVDILSTVARIIIYLIAIFSPPNALTSEVSFESSIQKLVFYNYSYVIYTSPFALNYSHLLFGNTYKVDYPKEVQHAITIQKQEHKDNRFSLDWVISFEKKCPLPNGAKIEIITNEASYTITKSDSKFKLIETSCDDCDIVLKIYEYPSSEKGARELFDKGKIKVDIKKNIFELLLKGYGSTYTCLQKWQFISS